MSCYVSSKENRYYAAIEQSFGYAATVTEDNRLPAIKLEASQRTDRPQRRDKTGTRTFLGLPEQLRRETSFEITNYMTSWASGAAAPSYGPLFQAGLGSDPLVFAGGTVGSLVGVQLRFAAPHGLVSGQGISCGGEIRFVMAVLDEYEVVLNAPLTEEQAAGWPVDRTVTYQPASELPSVSIYDHWSPSAAVQRIVAGSVVDQVGITINGDFHEFLFGGPAADLIDSASFESGQAGLTQFPAEPTPAGVDYALVPGHLGQVWLGNNPDQFHTLTKARISVNNGVSLRAKEFGFTNPRCIVAGDRSVTADFSLFEKPDTPTESLYQASRQRSPISAMFQLGQQPAQLCGVYLPSLTPEVPEFHDEEAQLEWRFQSCRAQGLLDDEIYIAFG